MTTKVHLTVMLALIGATLTMAQEPGGGRNATPPRPQGPCDIYAAAGDACAAAHSTTRALYASYNGPLYQVLRQSDGEALDISVVQPSASPVPDAGGYANAATQDRFCANTYCWITTIYDQSPKHNDLIQAPRGGFSGPAMGGFNNLPVADMAQAYRAAGLYPATVSRLHRFSRTSFSPSPGWSACNSVQGGTAVLALTAILATRDLQLAHSRRPSRVRIPLSPPVTYSL